MKKGYVLEVKEEHLLVMSQDQKFLRLQKRQGVDVGEEILFSENQELDIARTNNGKENFMKKIKHAKPMGIAAAMVLFLVLSIFAVSGGEAEAQYLLSFDINPGVVIEVGEEEKVLEVYAANDKAKELDLKHLEGETLEVFLDEFMEKLAEKDYLNNDSAQVLLSYADLLEDEEASQDLIDRVTEQMQNYFSEKNLMVDINTLLAEGENYESARLEGITLGKFQLIKAIQTEERKVVEIEDMKAAEGTVEEDGKVEEGTETEDAKEAAVDTTEYRDMPVRELLEHPVFERHPRDRKAEGLHPVFDVHPRDWNAEDGEKPHPVFKEHPGNRGNDDEEQDLKDGEGTDKEPRDEEKEHPVFDQHPRDRDKEAGEHPVFDKQPGDQENSDDQESDENQEKNRESEEDREPDEKPVTPPVDKQPENPGSGNN